MLQPKSRRLLELSNVYVKDGRLLKYRAYSTNIYHEDNYFHHLARQQGKASESDMEVLKTKDNVTIELGNTLLLLNFDDARLTNLQVAEDFKVLRKSPFEHEVLTS